MDFNKLIPDNVSKFDNVYDVLKERGFIEQSTDEDKVRELLKNEKVKFYIGFDPTADCLHVGHFMQVIIMMYMQKFGHTPVVLIGGGTGMVGDPSGRTDMRQVMDIETIEHNCEQFKKLFDQFLDFDEEWKYEGNEGVYVPGHQNKEPEPGKAVAVNNARWLRPLNYIDFLREVGSQFNVNTMLRAECFKQRMEREGGLTMFELNYMLMQSYDFLQLFEKYGCCLQTGGDDQWSNMLSGADLIRRKLEKPAFALTFKLLLTQEGKKMGKTEKGALWLDPANTSPYDFYQYWRNVDDADVEKCLSLLTFLPMDEVKRLGALKDSRINEAKVVLAYEVTKLIHGEEEANKAKAAAEALFSGSGSAGSTPKTEVTEEELEAENRLLAWAARVGLFKSNGEARKAIQQGGLYIGNDKVTDEDFRITKEMLAGDGLLIRRGKKAYHQLVLK